MLRRPVRAGWAVLAGYGRLYSYGLHSCGLYSYGYASSSRSRWVGRARWVGMLGGTAIAV